MLLAQFSEGTPHPAGDDAALWFVHLVNDDHSIARWTLFLDCGDKAILQFRGVSDQFLISKRLSSSLYTSNLQCRFDICRRDTVMAFQ